VVIITRNGIPIRIKKAETFSDLKGDLKNELSILLQSNEKEKEKEKIK